MPTVRPRCAEAFTLLLSTSQNANIKVHDIASRLADEVNGNTNPVGTG